MRSFLWILVDRTISVVEILVSAIKTTIPSLQGHYWHRDPEDLDWESEPAPLTRWMGGKPDDISVIVGTVY